MLKSILFTLAVVTSASAFTQNYNQMKSINKSAPVKCSKSITIKADAQKVWAVLTDINNWALWQTDITQPTLRGPLAPGTAFVWKTGGAKVHSTLQTVIPPLNFGWTGKTFGMYAVHNWTLSSEGGKTTVQVDESLEGFLARLLKKSFNKSLATGMQNWLELLKQQCEK